MDAYVYFLDFCTINFKGTGSCLRSLVGLLLEYSETMPYNTLNLHDEFPGPWIRQVSFDIPFR